MHISNSYDCPHTAAKGSEVPFAAEAFGYATFEEGGAYGTTVDVERRGQRHGEDAMRPRGHVQESWIENDRKYRFVRPKRVIVFLVTVVPNRSRIDLSHIVSGQKQYHNTSGIDAAGHTHVQLTLHIVYIKPYVPAPPPQQPCHGLHLWGDRPRMREKDPGHPPCPPFLRCRNFDSEDNLSRTHGSAGDRADDGSVALWKMFLRWRRRPDRRRRPDGPRRCRTQIGRWHRRGRVARDVDVEDDLGHHVWYSGDEVWFFGVQSFCTRSVRVRLRVWYTVVSVNTKPHTRSERERTQERMNDAIVPLLVFEDGIYRLHEPTLEWLTERKTPFATLACAGKFRTGKSFLLNRLLQNDPGKGFGVGETVQACTRGIWISRRVLNGTNGVDVLVMDTEGIDALDAENEHDVRIFAIAVLLSSVFLYNSMSHLDEAAVQTLSLMTRVAESLGTEHTPALYWILRDFALQMVDADGKTLSHAQYLEQALEPPTTSKCSTREAINAIFPKRHLVTLPRPHRGETAQKLDLKGTNALQPKFEKFLGTFRKHLLDNAKPICADDTPMTGGVFVAYAKSIVDKVNETGVVPRIRDSWSLLVSVQHTETERNARETLLRKAEEECPTAERAEVREWVLRAVDLVLTEEVRFMSPQPDLSDIHTRLCSDVERHVVALGRVQREEDVAREFAERAIGVFVDSKYRTLVPSTHSHLCNTKLLERVVWTLPAMQSLYSEEGKCDTLELDTLREEIRQVRAQLEESRTREAETLSSVRLRPLCEHATTDTSDLLTSWGGEGGVEAEPTPSDDLEEPNPLTDLEATLASMENRAIVAEERVRTLQDREDCMRSTFVQNMETLRCESVEQLEEYCRVRDEAVGKAAGYLEQKKVLEQECDKLRGLLREAQERALDVHRTTLDELRRRDTETRTSTDAQRKEFADLYLRSETVIMENKTLKRRVDELLVDVEETKRLRSDLQRSTVDRALYDAERETLRLRVRTTDEESSCLRATNVQLENRVAVLEATAKLESCRRSLASI